MKVIYIVNLLLICVALTGQTVSYTKVYSLSYLRTAQQCIVAPVRWELSDWLTTAGLVGTGVAIYLYDEDINRFVQDNRSDATHNVSLAAKQFGEGVFIIPAMGATLAAGYVFDSDKTKDTGFLCLKSFLLANGATQVLKLSTQRQRPFSDNGKRFWNGKGFALRRDSFPSGHTTVAWSIAPILAAQYNEQKWVAPVAYTIAGLTGYSRMHDEKHWASDVFAGIVIGYVTAQVVLQSTPRLEISPDITNRSLNLTYKF